LTASVASPVPGRNGGIGTQRAAKEGWLRRIIIGELGSDDLIGRLAMLDPGSE
jgi:hypothetical protein